MQLAGAVHLMTRRAGGRRKRRLVPRCHHPRRHHCRRHRHRHLARSDSAAAAPRSATTAATTRTRSARCAATAAAAARCRRSPQPRHRCRPRDCRSARTTAACHATRPARTTASRHAAARAATAAAATVRRRPTPPAPQQHQPQEAPPGIRVSSWWQSPQQHVVQRRRPRRQGPTRRRRLRFSRRARRKIPGGRRASEPSGGSNDVEAAGPHHLSPDRNVVRVAGRRVAGHAPAANAARRRPDAEVRGGGPQGGGDAGERSRRGHGEPRRAVAAERAVGGHRALAGIVGRPQHQRRHHRGRAARGPGPDAHRADAGDALRELHRQDRRREAGQADGPRRQPGAGGRRARLRQPARAARQPDALHDVAEQGEDQGRLVAGAARSARAGQRAGDVPAHPARRAGDVLAGDLQLPVVAPEPGGADAAGDAAGNEHDHRRQRPRHGGAAAAGGSGCSSTRAASARR